MRVARLGALLVALLFASPSAADITARYALEGGRSITVRVSDSGDSRVSLGNEASVITIGGVSYALMSDTQGMFAIRQEEMLAALRRAVRGTVNVLVTEAPADLQPELTAHRFGEERVAGRSGTRWVLDFAGAEPVENPHWTFVISEDPELAPVGRALARQYLTDTADLQLAIGLGRPFGSVPRALHPQIRTGTLIRMDGMTLESVDTSQVPAATFVLPVTILDGNQFLARIGLSLAEAD